VGDPVLVLKDLAIAYESTPLLSGVNFSLARGELVAVAGPSGCGKTTLLRTVAGLVDPAGGVVMFGGAEISVLQIPEYRRQVVYVDQKQPLFEATVLENLERPFRYRSATTPFPRKRAEELLDAVGLTNGRLEQQAKSLSVGQQQRLCLVRALLLDPKVLLLDEPTSALDPANVEAFESILRSEIKRIGASAMVISHDREQAKRLCSSTLVLDSYMVASERGEGK
jgi:ABC-type iron transport system FetAB ATPase subunit